MIINRNTVWEAGATINLNEDLQIAPGVKLTISEGVTVNGGKITAFGELEILGTANSRVVFNEVDISAGSVSYNKTSVIAGSFFTMNGGGFLDAGGNSSHANFRVSDAFFNGTDGFYIWYPYGNNSISKSVFKDSYGLSIGVSGASVTLENNLFYPSTYTYNENATIVVWANYGNTGDVTVSGNNFLDHMGRVAIALPEGYSSSKLHATGNYFDVPSEVTVESLVLDQSDSFHRASVIDLIDSRKSANPEAPSLKDVSQAPTEILLSNTSLLEETMGAVVGSLWATDPDAREVHSFTVSDTRFEVVGGALKLKAGVSLDHEAEATVPIEVTATDVAGLSLTQRFDVAVSNVNEVATAVRLSSATVRENAAGATIGQLTVTDPDAGDRHSFTVSDTRFEVVGGALKLKAGVVLDHEAGATVPIEVTATDAAGLSLTQRFALDVQNVVEEVQPPVVEEKTGGSSGDTPKGTKGNDVLVGNGGKDKLVGGAGNDDLLGGAGHDKLLGGKGNDTLAGDEGNDKLVGGGGRDVLDGGVGRDKLLGGGGHDRLSGGEGNDRLIGGGGKDRLDGGDGNDKMKGGGGADTFIFDLGNDKLVGGGGRDTVEFDGAGDDYDITFGKKVIVISEDDRDVLIGMERLDFDDVTYARQGGDWVEV